MSLLTEGLVARGVDVTLFATADSITSGRLRAVAPTGYSEDPTLDAKVREALHIASLFETAAGFDLIHNSFDFLPLAFTRLVDTPVVPRSTGLPPMRLCRSMSSTPTVFGMSPSARPTDTPPCGMRRPSITGST